MLDTDGTEDDLRRMFLREVTVAATLEHPNVVEVLDAGQTGRELFLVMELVEGPSLAEIVDILREQNKILPVEVSCHIVSNTALGLAHAHNRAMPDGTPLGIVHRDVATENVLVGTDGNSQARGLRAGDLGRTPSDPARGRSRSPPQPVPEQARGTSVDTRSDIFSLGALLFELTAGQPLYPNEAIASLLWKVAAGDYPPLEPRLEHIDSDLVAIMKTALAIDPAKRFRSAREMERALDSFRAARGMRASSRTLAQAVTMTWPQIQENRKRKMNNLQGELESAVLTFPADQLDTDSMDIDPSGTFTLPAAKVETSAAHPVAPRQPSTPIGNLADSLKAPIGRTSKTYSKPKLSIDDVSSDLPRPSVLRKPHSTAPSTRTTRGWSFYVTAVFMAAALTFAVTWWAAG